MTHAKSIILRHFIWVLAIQAVAFAILGLPNLAPYRDAVASTLGLQSANLWILGAVGIMTVTALSLRKLSNTLARALQDVSNQCKAGHIQALKRDYACSEEKVVCEYMLQLQEKARLAATTNSALEKELFVANQERRRAVEKKEESEDLLADYSRVRQELSIDNASLRAEKERLQEMLHEERRSKVHTEVELRAEEINAQLEQVISAAAIKSIWLPGFIGELRTPINVIQGLSQRMVDQWDQFNFGRLRETAQEILLQSELQIQRINDIMPTAAFRALPDGSSDAESELGDAERSGASDQPQQLGEELHRLFEKEDSGKLRVSISLRGDSHDLRADRHSLGFVRSLFHLVRDQISSGKLAISVDQRSALAPRFNIGIQGGARAESITDLASQHAIDLELSEQGDSDLTLKFPIAAAAPNSERGAS